MMSEGIYDKSISDTDNSSETIFERLARRDRENQAIYDFFLDKSIGNRCFNQRSKKNSISGVPLFLTWTVDPKKNKAISYILKYMTRKIRCLVQLKPKKLQIGVEHIKSNLHFHMYLESTEKLRTEHLLWGLGIVNKQKAKGTDGEITSYLCKENPLCDLNGLEEAEAMQKWFSYCSNLF